MLKNWLRKHPFALAVVGFLVTWFVLEYFAGLLGMTEELAEGELLSIYRVALCLFAAVRLFQFDRFTSDERVIWTYCLVGLTVCVVYIELIYLIRCTWRLFGSGIQPVNSRDCAKIRIRHVGRDRRRLARTRR